MERFAPFTLSVKKILPFFPLRPPPFKPLNEIYILCSKQGWRVSKSLGSSAEGWWLSFLSADFVAAFPVRPLISERWMSWQAGRCGHMPLGEWVTQKPRPRVSFVLGVHDRVHGCWGAYTGWHMRTKRWRKKWRGCRLAGGTQIKLLNRTRSRVGWQFAEFR